jgi:hypothetical protein
MRAEARKTIDLESWRVQLEIMLARVEDQIVQAEMRIERHCRLARGTDAPRQQQLHAHVHFNLLEGLELLHLQRSLLSHELYGPKAPRVVPPKRAEDTPAQAAASE